MTLPYGTPIHTHSRGWSRTTERKANAARTTSPHTKTFTRNNMPTNREQALTYQPEAIRIADGLDQNVQIDPQTSEDELGGYRSELDELMADAAAILRSQYARIAELEAKLYAVGAGGVGQSIKTQMQADTDPAAWAIYSDDGTAIRLWSRDKATAQEAADKFGLPLVALYTAPKPTENLRCKSTQKRLATLWGYVKPQHLQPLTDEQMYSLYCEAMKGYYVSSLHYWRDTEAHKFARAIEAAHGITESQP